MTAPASAIAGVAVELRDPFPPHRIFISAKVEQLSYGFMLMKSSTAQFVTSLADELPEYAWSEGNMVTVRRSDGVLPWYGFITHSETDSDAGSSQITAVDYAGALLGRALGPKDWPQEKKSAGEWMRSLALWADHHGRPPLMMDVRLVLGGAPVQLSPSSEDLASLLDTMAASAGWEWEVRCAGIDSPASRRAALVFRERVGRDLSRQIVFEHGRHFTKGRLTRDAEGLLEDAVAIGSSGPVAGRPSVAVNRASSGSPGVDGLPLETRRASVKSPALAGSRVAIEPAVTNREALGNVARRMHRAPDDLARQVSFTVAETETDMRFLEIGSIYRVRDRSIGLDGDKVRIVAINLSTDGEHDIEAEVLRAA